MALIPDITQAPKNTSANKSVSASSAKKKVRKQKSAEPTPVTQGATKKVITPAAPKSPVRHTGRFRRWCKRYRALLVALLILFVLSGTFTAVQAKRLYKAAQGAKAEFDLASQSADQQKFEETATHLDKGSSYLVEAQAASRGLFLIKWLPVIRTQFKVVDTLIAVGINVATAGQDILPIASRVEKTLGDDNVTVDAISTEERRTLLEAISQSPEQLNSAQAELESALTQLEQLPKSGVLGPLGDIVTLLQTQLPNFKTAVTKGIPFLKVAPTILGYPDEQTYLFLLQNNTELRPTGGFIGTYGILRLHDGDIAEFKTDNIYNLDNPVKKELYITPPEPFNRFLGSTQWFMRDSNWNPDFPISAQKAEEFYHLEHGPVQKIDGVIAVTPVVIHDLLAVTGPITIDGTEYTADNLTETLQYEVEVGFKQDNISDAGRKEVIGKLAGEIMDRILRLPKSQWPQLVEMLLHDLEEKHIMIYSKDDDVQTLVRDIGWDGAIHQTADDFLMVVDSNLAALKTDRVMTKHLEYNVYPEGDDLVAELTLRYQNDGEFNFFTTRYRTYTRIYVPAGSELISSSGFLTNDRYLGGQPAEPVVSLDDEVHKTVIAGFISVEPKTEEVITLKYRLPNDVTERLSTLGYNLYIQKQAGTDNVDMTANIQTPRSIQSLSVLDGLEKVDHNKAHLVSPLSTDLVVELIYE